MAIYMCSVKVIKRSEGKSVVAAAAYRAGETITNNWDGITHQYKLKQNITHTEIMLPDHAPKEFQSRSILWNSVEAIEKASTSRLAKEVLIALPREMSSNEQIALVEDYVKNTFVIDGMCADIAIHNPPLKNDLGQPIDYDNHVLTDSSKYIYPNPHAHILLTMRPINQKGEWEGKSSIEYICKNSNGEEKAFTASELNQYKHHGWEKQYKYTVGKQKKWLTASEASTKGLKRINRTPKTSIHGRPNPTIAKWESPQTIYNWRKSWEIIANKHLEMNGYSARIDCRSYESRGDYNYIPTVHLGPASTKLLRRAKRNEITQPSYYQYPELARLNAEIISHNKLVFQLTNEINIISNKINELCSSGSQDINAMKTLLDQKRQERNTLNIQFLEKKSKLLKLQQSIILIKEATEKVNNKNLVSSQSIEQYTSNLNSLGFFNRKEKEIIKEKIYLEHQNIKARNQYLANIYNQCNIISVTDLNKLMNEYSETDKVMHDLTTNLAICVDQLKQLSHDYINLLQSFSKNTNDSYISHKTK